MLKRMPILLSVLMVGCTPLPVPLHDKVVDLTDNKRVVSIQLYNFVPKECLSGHDPKPPVEEYLQDYLLFDVTNTEKGALFTNLRRSYIAGDHYADRRVVSLRDWKTHKVENKIRILQNWVDSCNPPKSHL